MSSFVFLQAVKILNLIPNYLSAVTSKDWESYRNCYPALFDHYRRFVSDANFRDVKLTADELEWRSDEISSAILRAVDRLRRADIETSDLAAVIFVGQSLDNGHAFEDAGHFVAWFAAECYADAMTMNVFTMHELVHAIHYKENRVWYYHTHGDKSLVWRQLITEGLATYATKQLYHLTDLQALWGGTIESDEASRWHERCNADYRILCERLYQTFNESQPSNGLFSAGKLTDRFGCRQGYYVGLKIIEAIASRGYALNELVSSDVESLKATARAMLVAALA